MGRGARLVTGGLVAALCGFVALVAGLVATTGGDGLDWPIGPRFAGEPVVADAEVLNSAATTPEDVPRWRRVSLAIPTAEGEVITWVDWPPSLQMPFIGDIVEVVYDSGRPERAYSADDPYVDGLVEAREAPESRSAAAPGRLDAAARWVAVLAGAAFVVTLAVTLVAARRGGPAPASGVAVAATPPGTAAATAPTAPTAASHLDVAGGLATSGQEEPAPTGVAPGLGGTGAGATGAGATGVWQAPQ